ncbi:unnamed protein product [Trichobilharzia regenti]|nr:unnamed protein product [Trichobilharzia regenti]
MDGSVWKGASTARGGQIKIWLHQSIESITVSLNQLARQPLTKMLRRMLDESKASEKSQSQCTALDEIESQTDLLILIDRSVDPLTPLLNQLTYAGLVDEKWGIRFGECCKFLSLEINSKVYLFDFDFGFFLGNTVTNCFTT